MLIRHIHEDNAECAEVLQDLDVIIHNLEVAFWVASNLFVISASNLYELDAELIQGQQNDE